MWEACEMIGRYIYVCGKHVNKKSIVRYVSEREIRKIRKEGIPRPW